MSIILSLLDCAWSPLVRALDNFSHIELVTCISNQHLLCNHELDTILSDETENKCLNCAFENREDDKLYVVYILP